MHGGPGVAFTARGRSNSNAYATKDLRDVVDGQSSQQGKRCEMGISKLVFTSYPKHCFLT